MFQRADVPALPDTSAAIYQQFAPDILAYIRRRTATPQDAEDILVETFLAALENAPFARLVPEEQAAWLFRVAHNKIISYYRRVQRQPAIPLDVIADAVLIEEMNLPEAIALRHEEQRALREAMQQLSPLQQTVLRMRFAEGLHSPQIAQALGKSEEAIRKLLSRTLNQLRLLYPER
jgi:RNA polymerase sigma factor (sigma-70 family)